MDAQDSAPTISSETTSSGEGKRRSLFRLLIVIVIGVLFAGDLVMYSLYQTLSARAEIQEHRLDRLDTVLNNMILSNENAKTIKKIEQQVDGIEGQINEVAASIQAPDAETSSARNRNVD